MVIKSKYYKLISHVLSIHILDFFRLCFVLYNENQELILLSEITNHGMDTPNKILDHDIENGLLLDQIEDNSMNDDEIDEATLLEIDQIMNVNTKNDTNLFDMMDSNDSIIENYSKYSYTKPLQPNRKEQ